MERRACATKSTSMKGQGTFCRDSARLTWTLERAALASNVTNQRREDKKRASYAVLGYESCTGEYSWSTGGKDVLAMSLRRRLLVAAAEAGYHLKFDRPLAELTGVALSLRASYEPW